MNFLCRRHADNSHECAYLDKLLQRYAKRADCKACFCLIYKNLNYKRYEGKKQRESYLHSSL